MSSFRLTPTSSLGAIALPAVPGAPGVTIAERTGVSLCSIFARKGAEALLADRVRQVFSVELPRVPLYTGPAPVAFAWAGPSHWLAFGEQVQGPAFELHLRSSLAGHASVMDQSDGRLIVRISGPCARRALSKGVHIDLHSSVFQPGCTAITTVSHIGAHFWQVDSAPTYEFAVFRSFAVSFWEWLVDAASEFGVAVSGQFTRGT